MENLKSNIKELFKVLNEQESKDEVAIEFLEAIESGVDEFIEELSDRNRKIKELEEEAEDDDGGEPIISSADMHETAFGNVFIYNETGNLKLQELIDEFAEKLKTV